MRISDVKVEKLLEQGGKTSPEQMTQLKEVATRSRRPLQEIVVQNEVVTEEELTKLFSDYSGIPYIQLDPKDIPSDVLTRIPERIATQYLAVLFKIDSDGLMHLVMDDPDDIQAVDFIKKQVGDNIKIYVTTRETILACLDNYRGDVNKQLNDVIDIQREDDGSEQVVSDAEIAEDSAVAQTINLLLEYAIRSNASDIHIEPREEYVQVRYRIDGVLTEVNRLPRNVLGALTSRIKILSNLKIDERRVPQDGRFKIKVAGKQYALRVSTLPIADGEKIVMRILNESNQEVSLEELGYWGSALTTMRNGMAEPNGIMLITGPTGSGKSTSLFSALSILNKPEVNISTVEDPVEYKIPGVNQTQTNPKAGMTFATGLRALLRQDPNIIMVGEIRDAETADLAVQAALTGHLVFSTLHTNNAATSLPRLLDMGIEPFLIASTIRGVIGQRLVRRLCMACREQFTPTPEELGALDKTFGITAVTLPKLAELEKQAKEQNIGSDTELSMAGDTIKTLWRASANGCEECNKTGYKGRIGIYEGLQNSSSIQKLIVSNATSDEIQAQAITEGMITMQLDGLIKSLRGQTSVEEIMRATRE